MSMTLDLGGNMLGPHSANIMDYVDGITGAQLGL
jgi:hypothetical protein